MERLLQAEARIPFGMITVTNNTGGGQPVSITWCAYAALLKRHGKPLVMDVCRFAENAMFVRSARARLRERHGAPDRA